MLIFFPEKHGAWLHGKKSPQVFSVPTNLSSLHGLCTTSAPGLCLVDRRGILSGGSQGRFVGPKWNKHRDGMGMTYGVFCVLLSLFFEFQVENICLHGLVVRAMNVVSRWVNMHPEPWYWWSHHFMSQQMGKPNHDEQGCPISNMILYH